MELAVWFLVLVTTLWDVAAKALYTKCEADHECGENGFCYETGLCTTCLDCSVYSRKPHEWKSCSKSPSECGDCFDGFTADTLFDGKVRDFCKALGSAKNSRDKSDTLEAGSLWYYTGFTVGIPTLALLVILFLCWRYIAPRQQLAKSKQPSVELVYERPPPYFNNGESPLLRRDTVGGLHCQSDPAWEPYNVANSNTTYQDKEHEMKLFVVERATDGFQQARPFKIRPEDVKKCRATSRKRSTCRPEEPLENYNKDDDNEDGLSITHGSRISGHDSWNSGPGKTEYEEQEETGKTAADKRQFVASERGSSSSLCGCQQSVNCSSYSLLSETLVDSINCEPKENLKCSSEKNILNVIPLTSKFDSGFISESSSRLVEMHDNSYRRNSSETPNQFEFTETEKNLNISVPVTINILNTIHSC